MTRASSDRAQQPAPLGWRAPRASVLLRPFLVLAACSTLAQAPLLRRSRAAQHQALSVLGPSAGRTLPTLEQSLVQALTERGLHAEAPSIRWAGGTTSHALLARESAFVLARTARGGKHDVYLADVVLAPGRRFLDLHAVHALTQTAAVDETALAAGGQVAAWLISGGGRVYGLETADLAGEDTPEGPEWTWLARWQQRLTHLQTTGRRRGVARRSFKLDPAAAWARVTVRDGTVRLDADTGTAELPREAATASRGAALLRERPRHQARPGNLVTWAVDRARQLSWLGDERLQLIKALAYAGLDRVSRLRGAITTEDASRDIAEDLGALLDRPPARYTDPETGWPPRPMAPILPEALEGEGQWYALDDDPFVQRGPDGHTPLVTSFIRADRERKLSRIYVVAWDPRQVALHLMAGTEEPRSATGETGDGMVPRSPRVLSRLVAAFNGGFQSTHGDYGMMVDGAVLVPPKPFAATVAEGRDGSALFGTWPRATSVPAELLSFRQNLTPLVQDGAFNPYGRQWWGGVPQGWEDTTRTVRSGLCLTAEGYLAYFYGAPVDHEALARAMQAARCGYGLHLDMNQGHTGLELYRAAPSAELPRLAEPLDSLWKTQGPVPQMPGWSFRARRLIKNLQLMHFPRYIQRAARDFFYLTLRDLLPGPNLAPPGNEASREQGRWRVSGLPQHGFPYAVATTWLHPDPAHPQTRVRIAKLDPRMLRVASAEQAQANTVVSVTPADASKTGSASLWLDDARFDIGIGDEAPPAGATLLLRGEPEPAALDGAATAAFGVTTESGMLVYLELSGADEPGQSGRVLAKLLDRLECRERLFRREPAGLALGGQSDLSGHPVPSQAHTTYLVRGPAPGARRFFTDTPILPRSEWEPLQRQDRWFADPFAPADAGVGSGSGTGSSPTPPDNP